MHPVIWSFLAFIVQKLSTEWMHQRKRDMLLLSSHAGDWLQITETSSSTITCVDQVCVYMCAAGWNGLTALTQLSLLDCWQKENVYRWHTLGQLYELCNIFRSDNGEVCLFCSSLNTITQLFAFVLLLWNTWIFLCCFHAEQSQGQITDVPSCLSTSLMYTLSIYTYKWLISTNDDCSLLAHDCVIISSESE